MSHVTARRPSFLAPLLAALAGAACADPERVAAPPTLAPPPAASRAAASQHTVRVRPGASIQAAVDAVGANGTVLVEPGVYPESVVVAVPGVRLLGLGGAGGARVVITNPGGAHHGIRVAPTGAGFVLENVTVRRFARNGVLLVGVDGFRLARVHTERNGEYGLFPVRSSHGVIDHCTATGHADTGIYVGQSSDVVIRHSVAWRNVAGFELENSTRVSLEHSEAYDNAVGVLVSLVPGLRVMTASENVVAHNHVHHNNLPNFGDPDDLAGLLPPGSGILVVGPDRVTVEDNVVTDNASTGIAVVSAALITLLMDDAPPFTVDPAPDHVVVRSNQVTGNGAAPRPPLSAFFPGVDLLWDGSGVDDCWTRNRFGSSAPSPLPACA